MANAKPDDQTPAPTDEEKPQPKKAVVPLNQIAKETMEPIIHDLPSALPDTISLDRFKAAFITSRTVRGALLGG